MKIWRQGRIWDSADMDVWDLQRAWNYGDGFFETLLLHHGRWHFSPFHAQRMEMGARQLQLQGLPSQQEIEHGVAALVEESGLEQEEWIAGKLLVWRQNGGRWLPHSHQVEYMLYLQPTEGPVLDPIASWGIADSVRLAGGKGGYKPLSGQVYVQTGLEMQQRRLDSIVLLDAQGHLAEFYNAALFWMQEGTIYTPSLATGKVQGVLERAIRAWAMANDWEFQEVQQASADWQQPEQVFSANLWGLRSCEKWDSRTLKQALPFTYHELLQSYA